MTTEVTRDAPQIRTSGWLPRTLRRRYLIPLACLMFFMLLVTEFLRQLGNNEGSLSLFTSTNQLTDTRKFAYIYVPTILSMIIAVLWSLVEYDALRLEPYFQLSRPQGAPADVLLLNYEFGHYTTAPFFAMRNRHWLAVCISILSILLQLVFPSLQSSLFNMDDATVYKIQHLQTWPTIVNLEEQGSLVDNSIPNMTSIRDHRDLSYSQPESSKYAMAPVAIPLDIQYDTKMWELTQSIYWTELSCTEIDVEDAVTIDVSSNTSSFGIGSPTRQPLIWNLYDVSTTDNCILELSEEITIPPTNSSVQISHWQPNASTTSLTKQCASFDLIGLTVDVSLNKSSELDRQKSDYSSSDYTHQVSGFGCKLVYLTTEAGISVQVNGSLSIVDLHPNSTTEVSRASLNTTHFKSIILQEVASTNGTSTFNKKPVRPSTLHRDLISKLETSVQGAFVPLMNRIFDLTSQSHYVQASHVTHQMAIIVGPVQSFLSEAILLFGVAMVLYLAYTYPNRPNMLRSDPASIASMCGIMADVIDASCLSHLNLDQLSTRQLRTILKNYTCRWQQASDPPRICIEPSAVPRSQRQIFQGKPDPRPHFLLIPIFALEIFLFIAVFAGIVTIFVLCAKDGAFHSLTYLNSDNLAALFQLIPSALASIIRALCLSIYRYLSVLEPWSVLQAGGASAASSLLLEYGSLNPIASLFKWFSYRHFLLGLVGVACMLNTAMSILASGLFRHELGPTRADADMKSNYSYASIAIRQASPIGPELETIKSSIYSGTSVLSWTTSSYSFLPAWTDTSSEWLVGGTIRGVGADLVCKQLSIADSYSEDPVTNVASWQYSPFNESDTVCQIDTIQDTEASQGNSLTVRFFASPTSAQSSGCQKPAVVVVAYPSGGGYLQTTPDTAVALYCESLFLMQNFSVGFNSDGYIQYHVPLNGTFVTDDAILRNGTTNLANYNLRLSNPLSVTYNDSHLETNNASSTDWFGTLTANLYRILDTNTSVITANVLESATRNVYRSIFATDLSLERDAYFQLQDHPARISDGIIYNMSWAVVPSFASFMYVLIIVVFDGCVVASVFLTRRGRFRFPRIPRSIGSIIPWVIHGQVLNDFKGTYAWSEGDREKHFVDLDKRYKLNRQETADGQWKYVLDEDNSRRNSESSTIELQPITPAPKNRFRTLLRRVTSDDRNQNR
ncbi:hypothetical protein BO83DRAFT_150530 [Aspergillus eucalypticola CBS 122712]|uniref:Uncharacterized protein n=1 Tax=Aspergillus eucalypticola (strain CBS 122712 / IBT 29274) TaxID=1448314 RepID=A0A317UUL3_ASPEC|nr:uncharacterized protein BO83DRAFT_150530 [Aspergillus eucalypticola CBS 122712]PWY63730.1 hypothetical protein BO83DRAFT_150530 [Aspergillus eucalypticola CBS 122712]